MKKIAFAVLLALGAATAAQAADVPVGSRYDGRIQYVNYNAGDVVIVRALPGLGARIVFAADEEILDVASGFTQGWEFSDRRNILYVKPKSIKTGSGQEAIVMAPEAGKWDTNLMVTTNRRMYDFDLKLLPGGGNSGKAPQEPARGLSRRVQVPRGRSGSAGEGGRQGKGASEAR